MHLDRVRPQEPVGGHALGDAGAHPLTRQRVPDEDHPALVARHADPAVGHRADLELVLGSDQAARPGPWTALVGGRAAVPALAAPIGLSVGSGHGVPRLVREGV